VRQTDDGAREGDPSGQRESGTDEAAENQTRRGVFLDSFLELGMETWSEIGHEERPAFGVTGVEEREERRFQHWSPEAERSLSEGDESR
jgi:hypothetical protein